MKEPPSISQRLAERKKIDTLRTLSTTKASIDFFSNDYLGIATSGILNDRLKEKDFASGATGSRLLSGNSQFAEELEELIAQFHNGESALLFNSGYDANVGLISALPTRHDSILYDELSHASIIDGARLSFAKHNYSFRHNDLNDLRAKAQQCSGTLYVIIESVYSMDGDFAPLIEFAEVCKEVGAFLIVDEAHATGVFGNAGQGRVFELGLEKEVFARVYTFGKALGCHGAAVVGSRELRSFLINFSRSFIYSTAPPPHSLHAIKESYAVLKDKVITPASLFMIIHEFSSVTRRHIPDFVRATDSPIQSISIGESAKAKALAAHLREHDIEARAIVSPTVKAGSERIRICLHSFNAPQEVQLLIHKTKEFLYPI